MTNTEPVNLKERKKQMSKVLKLKPRLAGLIVHILETPNQAPNTIRDVRVIEKVAQKLTVRAEDKVGPAPALRALNEGEKDHTDEEKKAHQEAMQKWNESVRAFQEEEIEFELDDTSFGIIKTRFSAFNNFMSNPEARKQILAVADQLGL